MKFSEAMKQMKRGIPMKLPSWGGYWCWDSEKETIMMYCRPKDSDNGNDVLDIRETQRVEYTLENVCSDEWIPANGDNCTIMGGTPTFGFGDAIKYLERGMKVTRKGWNGKDMYLRLILPGDACCDHYPMQSCIGMKTADCKMQPRWIASQADMLAKDWMFYE